MEHEEPEQIQCETITVNNTWLSHWKLTLMSMENQT